MSHICKEDSLEKHLYQEYVNKKNLRKKLRNEYIQKLSYKLQKSSVGEDISFLALHSGARTGKKHVWEITHINSNGEI